MPEKLQAITVYLPPEEVRTLNAEAAEAGRSGASAEIRLALARRRRDVAFTPEELATFLGEFAGAVSTPFMRDNPDYVMPTEELSEFVDMFMRRKGARKQSQNSPTGSEKPHRQA